MSDRDYDVRIYPGIAEKYLTQAAEVYYDAFQTKLAPLKGSKKQVVALLEQIFDPQQAMFAVQQGQCVGLAGLHYEGRLFTKVKFFAFVNELGWFYGVMGYLAFHVFEPRIGKNELRIECLAVAPEKRGQGIGTLLLAAVDELARTKGFDAVRLEVVDTNPLAQRLYERQGFRVTQTQHFPYLRRFVGYSSANVMVKKLS
jgi:ribosomal protein S18 acetylase RimI-like enzyme